MATEALETNPVKRAISLLGGATQAVVRTGISEATWHRWRRVGRICDSAAVFRVADLTGINPRELAGFEVMDGGRPPRGPKEVAARKSRWFASRSARKFSGAAATAPESRAHVLNFPRPSDRRRAVGE